MAERAVTPDGPERSRPGPPPRPEDLQGLLCYGYGYLPLARFYLLAIGDPGGGRKWLRDLLDMEGEGGWFETAREVLGVPRGPENRVGGLIQTARVYPSGLVGNIAFTWPGLRRLGLHPDWWTGFAEPFKQGMHARSHFLGDRGRNDRRLWLWGGEEDETIHVLLLVYGREDETFDSDCRRLTDHLEERGLTVTRTLDTKRLDRQDGEHTRVYEHFGFRDGIAQPKLPPFGDPDCWAYHQERVAWESGSDAPYDHRVAAGEFLLGYKDNWEMPSSSPRPLHDVARRGAAPDDFGRGGSYLVFRQLEQDPAGLWTTLRGLSDDPEERLWLAAKMMGRWPDGTPMHLDSGIRRSGGEAMEDEAFDYADDPDGLRCPLGAHTRRANPRSAILSDEPGLARDMSKRHRILRRGRTYGEPLAGGKSAPDLKNILTMSTSKFDDLVAEARREHEAADPIRGLHFLCFNADIQRQFEFLQKSWMLSPNFGDLPNDPDPYLGQEVIDGRKTRFTIPARPVRRCVEVNQWFVTVKGGGYFFFPSIPALEYLSTAPAEF